MYISHSNFAKQFIIFFFHTGFGTYALHGYIYSSLVGLLRLVPKPKGGKNDEFVVSVEVHSPKEEPTGNVICT